MNQLNALSNCVEYYGRYVTVSMARPRDRNSAEATELRTELTEIMRRLGDQSTNAAA
jgi:hypothetical protein